MSAIDDITEYIAGYWNEAARTTGARGFINALNAKDAVDTPFGEAELLTDGHRLGIVGVHVWIVNIGEYTVKITAPYGDTVADGCAWEKFTVIDAPGFSPEAFPEYPVTLHTQSFLAVPPRQQ